MELTHKFNIASGKTLCAHDFYEGQSRIDGVFCDYTKEEKFEFLKNCKDKGVVNMEMESLCFAGMLNHAKIRCKFFFVLNINYCLIKVKSFLFFKLELFVLLC